MIFYSNNTGYQVLKTVETMRDGNGKFCQSSAWHDNGDLFDIFWNLSPQNTES